MLQKITMKQIISLHEYWWLSVCIHNYMQSSCTSRDSVSTNHNRSVIRQYLWIHLAHLVVDWPRLIQLKTLPALSTYCCRAFNFCFCFISVVLQLFKAIFYDCIRVITNSCVFFTLLWSGAICRVKQRHATCSRYDSSLQLILYEFKSSNWCEHFSSYVNTHEA